MSSFADNLRKLPGVDHLAAIHLYDDRDTLAAVIENVPGSHGSVVIYHHLAQTFGAITPEAAEHGLRLYAEHTEEARRFPGSHPNIDRLLALVRNNAVLHIKEVVTCW